MEPKNCFFSFAHAVPYSLFFVSQNGEVQWKNNMAESQYGKKEERKTIWEELSCTKDAIFSHLTEVLEKNTSVQKQYMIQKEGKLLIALEVTVSPFTCEHSDFLFCVTNVFSEFSTVKTLNEKFSENKEIKSYAEKLKKYELAIENSSNSIVITSSKGIIEYVNRGFEKNMGYTREEVLGKNSTRLQAVDPTHPVYQEITETLKKKQTWAGELQNKKKNGEVFWERATVSPVFDSEGKFCWFITVKEDVTKEVELKQNLMKSNEKLQELDKRKDEFISIASHELRTPLTVIKGYSALLSDGMLGDITEKQKAYLEKITLSANNLIELVNDMLDLSKITSGRMVVSKTEVNLFDFFTRSVENMTPLFESKGISLQLLFLLPPDMKVSTDEKRLWQVMNNLLGNASKFSESGTTVSCTVEKNDTHWWFSVKDEGVGIPEDKLESIFEKFSQVENHLQRSSEGTGLGLPIVKEIVKLLGGEIFVESEISKGSCFTVKF